MILYSRVTEQPDSEPVTEKEAAGWLEYTGEAKLPMISGLITTARHLCESYAGLSFVTQIREVKLDYFPSRPLYIELPYGPVQAVTSVTYTNDEDGTTTLVEGTDFRVDNHSSVARLYPLTDGEVDSWPVDYQNIQHPITIEYQAGFDDVSYQPLPPQVKTAILRVVAKLSEGRGDEGSKDGVIDWETQTILDTVKVTWNANLY